MGAANKCEKAGETSLFSESASIFNLIVKDSNVSLSSTCYVHDLLFVFCPSYLLISGCGHYLVHSQNGC